MDSKLKQEKLKMWKKQQEELEKELEAAMVAKGKAAQEGDLSENAAYKDAVERSEVISARLASAQKIIKDLEKGT